MKNFQLAIIEGNLRQVNTEDGIGYYPDLQLLATIHNRDYILPHLFQGSTSSLFEAQELFDKIQAKGEINLNRWVEVEDNTFSYSKGNDEPYDSEEEYYMRAS